MNYIVLAIYSFECDHQGCDVVEEVHPWASPGKHRLAAAERELRQLGWQKNGSCHYCPEHTRPVTR